MKLSNKILQFSFVILILVFTSCTKKPEIQYTSTYKMSGEWFTQYYDNGTPITDFHALLTYNTSDPNSNQVWVDDHANATAKFRFISKFNIDYSNLSFLSMPAAANEAVAGRTVKVYEGKVIPRGGHSKTNVTVDSIYLKLEFSNDPGKVYEIKGHARTGFFEDEY